MAFTIRVNGEPVYKGDAANMLDALGKAAKAQEERAAYVAREVDAAVARRQYWPHDWRAISEGEPFTVEDAKESAAWRAGSEWDYAHGLLVLDAAGDVLEPVGVTA